MKATLIFVFCISFQFTIVSGGPVQWKEIDTRLEKIKNEVGKTAMYTKLLAWVVDHEAAAKISEEFDFQSSDASTIFEEAQALISSKSLTTKRTKELFQKFQKIVIRTVKVIEGTDIPQSKQRDIRAQLIESCSTMIKLVKEITEILDGVFIFEVYDFLDVEPKILKIKRVITDAVEFINAVAWVENVKFAQSLDDLVSTTKDLMGQAYALNANKSLTVEKVQEIQSQVNTHFSVGKSNLNREEMDKLSYTAQNEIRKSITEASKDISLNFRELLDILQGKSTSSIDWAKVIVLIANIQDELYSLIPNIGIVTFKDSKRKEAHEKISTIVEILVFKSVEILKQAKLKAVTKQLKANEAETDIEKTLNEVSKVRKEIRSMLGKLSPDIQNEVKNIITTTYNKMEEMGLDVVDLLNGKDGDMFYDEHDEL